MDLQATTSVNTDIVGQIRAPELLTRPNGDLERLATKLRRAMRPFEASQSSSAAFGRPLKVAVIASFLTDYLVDMLSLMLVRRGYHPTITAAGYGQLVTEVLTGNQVLSGKPDVVFFLPSHRDIRAAPASGVTRDEALRAADDEAGFWRDLVSRIAAPTVMLSFDMPPHRPLGEADGFLPGGLGRHIRQVNLALADTLPATVSLVDAEALQTRLGPHAHDPRLYSMCKQPFAMEALPEIADTLAAAAAGLLGSARKVLVLDLDHTVWGGVVGDVGLEGLALGPETAEGEAFVAFQRYALSLAKRGVLLAVCSKNHEEIARAAFRNHPAMVLREDDIACFVANFEDKATNLRRIAQTLNLGIDSLVFADDNPVERAWVSQQLPEVAVIDMPEDPSGYCAAVELAKVFPMHRLTQEDLNRTASYRSLAAAKSAASAAPDMDAFLKDLEPMAMIEAVDAGTLDRIVQLISKTNQFKLNPSVFSHEQIRGMAAGVVAMRLSDRLQDYGIVSIAVTDMDGDTLVVRNWVMSCRVFSRRLEHAMRVALAELAERQGAETIRIEYVASAKNGLVPAVLQSIGFVDRGDGLFETEARVPRDLAPHHMTIHSRRGRVLVDAEGAN